MSGGHHRIHYKTCLYHTHTPPTILSEYPFKENKNTLKKHTSTIIYTFLYLLKCTKTKLSKYM